MSLKENQTFPDNDPFNNNQITEAETEEINTCSWQSTHSPMFPRWQLQTDQERKDQDLIIQKLESKLKKLNQKPLYTNKIIPDILHQFESSPDNEEEEEEEGEGEEHEEGEGLPLLWKNKDQTLRKTENQYNRNQWWKFPCCR